MKNPKYTSDPKTHNERIENAHFQLENVVGWMKHGDYNSALLKAECLIDALKTVVEKMPPNQ